MFLCRRKNNRLKAANINEEDRKVVMRDVFGRRRRPLIVPVSRTRIGICRNKTNDIEALNKLINPKNKHGDTVYIHNTYLQADKTKTRKRKEKQGKHPKGGLD